MDEVKYTDKSKENKNNCVGYCIIRQFSVLRACTNRFSHTVFFVCECG